MVMYGDAMRFEWCSRNPGLPIKLEKQEGKRFLNSYLWRRLADASAALCGVGGELAATVPVQVQVLEGVLPRPGGVLGVQDRHDLGPKQLAMSDIDGLLCMPTLCVNA